jgi:hypothetical protein
VLLTLTGGLEAVDELEAPALLAGPVDELEPPALTAGAVEELLLLPPTLGGPVTKIWLP